jgi:hypothetical protein
MYVYVLDVPDLVYLLLISFPSQPTISLRLRCGSRASGVISVGIFGGREEDEDRRRDSGVGF